MSLNERQLSKLPSWPHLERIHPCLMTVKSASFPRSASGSRAMPGNSQLTVSPAFHALSYLRRRLGAGMEVFR